MILSHENPELYVFIEDIKKYPYFLRRGECITAFDVGFTMEEIKDLRVQWIIVEFDKQLEDSDKLTIFDVKNVVEIYVLIMYTEY